MVILIKRAIQEFATKHPNSGPALNKWYKLVKKADWTKRADIEKDFNHVDYVSNDRYIFNIMGNNFRLVAMIFFDKRTVYIRYIGTHSEYNKINCSTI